MNEHDVKNYLEQIYDVPVHHVRLTLNKGEQRLHQYTDKAPIDGEEGGKTPAAQHCGLVTQRTKVLEEESCSLLPCLHPLHKFFHSSFSFQSYEALYSNFCYF